MNVLRPDTLNVLRSSLPATASMCVEAIVTEVPGYHRAFDARLRHNIERAVEQALSTFLERQEDTTIRRFEATLEGARILGRGEAGSGRSTDALLSAYRVGARVAWQNFSATALAQKEDASAIATLAAATFAFIDELSAASLAGHTEALTRRTRELARRRDQLATALAGGENRAALERLAEQARWRIPQTLTALVMADDSPPPLPASIEKRALWAPAASGPAVVFVTDLTGFERRSLRRTFADAQGALGPTVEWSEVHDSLHRAQRAMRILSGASLLDCEQLLPELILDSDQRSTASLMAEALEPLAQLSDAKRDALAETLLTWLLLQGRREDVAHTLHIHPQTVRYRMNQLRELYADSLLEQRSVLRLILGLTAAQTMKERKPR